MSDASHKETEPLSKEDPFLSEEESVVINRKKNIGRRMKHLKEREEKEKQAADLQQLDINIRMELGLRASKLKALSANKKDSLVLPKHSKPSTSTAVPSQTTPNTMKHTEEKSTHVRERMNRSTVPLRIPLKGVVKSSKPILAGLKTTKKSAPKIVTENTNVSSSSSETSPESPPSSKSSNFSKSRSNNPYKLFKKIQENKYILNAQPPELEVPMCNCDHFKGNCGLTCVNRQLFLECDPDTCPCGDRCTNNRFLQHKFSAFEVKSAPHKGFGLFAKKEIKKDDLVVEYVGEVVDDEELQRRIQEYKGNHFYFLSLEPNLTIDASRMGNESRFINHSCDPNCETVKWLVKDKYCIGIFAIRDIKKGEEITFDYAFERYGTVNQICYCGSTNCRGFIKAKEKNREKSKEQIEKENNVKRIKKLQVDTKKHIDNIDHFFIPQDDRTFIRESKVFLVRNANVVYRKRKADLIRIRQKLVEIHKAEIEDEQMLGVLEELGYRRSKLSAFKNLSNSHVDKASVAKKESTASSPEISSPSQQPVDVKRKRKPIIEKTTSNSTHRPVGRPRKTIQVQKSQPKNPFLSSSESEDEKIQQPSQRKKGSKSSVVIDLDDESQEKSSEEESIPKKTYKKRRNIVLEEDEDSSTEPKEQKRKKQKHNPTVSESKEKSKKSSHSTTTTTTSHIDDETAEILAVAGVRRSKFVAMNSKTK